MRLHPLLRSLGELWSLCGQAGGLQQRWHRKVKSFECPQAGRAERQALAEARAGNAAALQQYFWCLAETMPTKGTSSLAATSFSGHRKVPSGMNWQFKSHVQSVLRCLNCGLIAGALERLVRSFELS